jgi:phosphoenolpyruvate-protein phosphotransferase (PTS system enzyme I)
MMKGEGVSPGISIGKAFIIFKTEAALKGIVLGDDLSKSIETGKFNKAVQSAVSEVENIKRDKTLSLTPDEMEILDTQVEFLNDPQIKDDVINKINSENKTANDALIEVFLGVSEMFGNLDDEYLKARTTDIQDAENRILKYLNTGVQPVTVEYPENTIIIAEDISPADAIVLDINKIKGFATRLGGRTSHAAIIAKAKGIPAVVDCGNALHDIKNNDTLILNGSSGEIILNPDLKTIDEYRIKQTSINKELSVLKSLKDLPAMTTDGHKVDLFANISGDADLEKVFENGGEGVGLFRTEMLFLGRNSFPSEEEQFQFYKKAAIKSKNKPVIVRTIDIGGDKQLSYFGIPPENNPFLGYRAIRICLDQKKIFFTQLRAILRASAFGNLKIMFPMICSLDEVRLAKECLKEVKNEMEFSGVRFNKNIETGIMLEIPSAALMADILAKEVDFFSIGTNDLCQYTLAVDRMNNKVSSLYSHFNPGLLRLIRNVIQQAHEQNKHVGMCGEMASDPLAAMLLLGMGLDEFSMGAASIPGIKKIIIRNSLSGAREICQKVMEMDSSESITCYLQKQFNDFERLHNS